MPKKSATPDELIWLFHEKLAGMNFQKAGIAILPGVDGSWTALTSALERRRFPELSETVKRIEKQLRVRYRLKRR